MAKTKGTGTKELQGVFIQVEVADEIRDDAELATKLEEVCPVDIYADDGGKVDVVEENLDECILCELCVEAAPPGTVVVKKLYDGTELRR
jgi:NAD-dependent dihydropyrimidine dehydrogenase PreA subunit